MTNFLCDICGQSFENGKVKSNHVRWKHGNIKKYKESSKKAALKVFDKKNGKIKLFTVNCKYCNKLFYVKERENTFPRQSRYFCSKKCSSKYSSSFVNKDKHHKSMIVFGNKIKRYPMKKLFVCITCDKNFVWIVNNNVVVKKTCSLKCQNELRSKISRENPNCGGELGYKHFRYKNVLMDSSWEVALAKWMDEKGIIWDRSRKRYMFWWTDQTGKKRRYYPDFYLPKYNVYADPKNKYKLSNDQYKLNCVIKENNITLFYGELNDIKKNIDILNLS